MTVSAALKQTPQLLAALALTVGSCLCAAAQSAATGDSRVLVGTVGPGFTIALENPRRHLVTSTPVGRYRITIRDRSSFLDFHLSGPGINKRTSVTGTGTATWTLTLRKGVYTYDCDDHANIVRGHLRVT